MDEIRRVGEVEERVAEVHVVGAIWLALIQDCAAFAPALPWDEGGHWVLPVV